MSTIYVYNGISSTDTVKGNSSDDTIVSHRNNATIYSYAGNDSFDLWAEENVVYAGNGNYDVLVWEWAPYTTVDGGAGDDEIDIRASNVTVNGGAGDDYITVNNLSREIKSVTVTGGGGNNVFAFDRYTGTDRSMSFVISDLHNGDTIRSIKADNIEIESSTVNGNIFLTESGKSAVNITLKGVSDISQVSDVVFRTKGESKTLANFLQSLNLIPNLRRQFNLNLLRPLFKLIRRPAMEIIFIVAAIKLSRIISRAKKLGSTAIIAE